MDFGLLNKIGLMQTKEVLKVQDMLLNETYKVLSYTVVTTRLGRAIVAETENNMIYLPQRLVTHITDADVEELNKGKPSLVYRGKKLVGKNVASLLEFSSK